MTPQASRIAHPMCRLGMAAYWLATVSCGPYGEGPKTAPVSTSVMPGTIRGRNRGGANG